MATELQLLIASIFLGALHITLAIVAATRVRGVKWNVGSRDENVAPLTGVARRLERASENFKETFAFFLAAVVIVQLTHSSSPLAAFGAHLYFWMRLLYLPLYAWGIPYVRTAVWSMATVGIFLILATAIL